MCLQISLLSVSYSLQSAGSYVKRNKLAMKSAGSGPIEMPIFWQNVKMPVMKNNNLVSNC